MGQTDLKPTAQGQVESSINDTINFIMAKVAAGEIDAATATELIAAARKDYESNVPVTTSAQQAVQPQQTANPYQADPQTAYAVPEMEPEQTPIRRFSNMSRNAISACIRTTSCKPTIRGDSRNAMQRPRMRQGI